MVQAHAHISVADMLELIGSLLVNIHHGISSSLLPNDLIRATLGSPYNYNIWHLEATYSGIIGCLMRDPGGG